MHFNLTFTFVRFIDQIKYVFFHYRNQSTLSSGRIPDLNHHGMSLEVLKDLVKADAANQKSIKAGDFDINQFLQQVKQEDLKWGFKQLTENQIEGKYSWA